MRRLLLAALLLPLLVPFVPRSMAAGGCALDLEQRNHWYRVGLNEPVAMEDADPCHVLMVAHDVLFASDDGGLSIVSRGPSPEPASRLIAAGLPSNHALLVGKSGTLWITTDRGRSWSGSKGLGGSVRTLSVDQADPSHVLAVVTPSSPIPTLPAPVGAPVATGSGLYESHDEGRTFAEVTGALALPATAAVVDAGAPSRWWLGVGGPAGGLYLSTDAGTTFTRAAAGEVTGLATSRLAGGGSEVVATTTAGVLVSRDGGTSVVTHLAGRAFSDLALEWEHPSAGLLLADSVRRTSDTATTVRGQSAGLPDACHPSYLRRDRSVPSVFLVDCADGTTWRYRSDGTDLSSIDSPDDATGGSLLPGSPVPSTPMRELRRLALPTPGSRADGSLAFDGSVLYYTDRDVPGRIHRMLAANGRALPDLRVAVRKGIGHLAYDANRDELILLDRAFVVWAVSLDTGRVIKLFHSPLSGQPENADEDNDTTFYGSMSYDSATDRILFANDQSDSFYEYDRDGRERHACPSLGLQTLITVNVNNGTGNRASIAGLVATGDGLVYVEAEDDATVVRIDRSCHVIAQFTHEFFSEAPNENDALACDTTSFSEPAVWLRDAAAARVIAYSVESGYCALPSAVTVTAPSAVAMGGSGRVCAHLRSRAKGTPLPGLPIDLLVAGRGIGSPVTNARGIACTDYVPLQGEAGSGNGTARSRQPVLAAFLGTAAYRPSDARASLVVSRTVVPPPPPPRPAAPALSNPAPAVIIAAPPPPPPVQPPQPPPPGPQQQPIAQGHPGAQPGAMGQVGAATMPEDEGEAAAQGADTHLMVGLDWEAYALPSAFGVLAFAAVLKRRRASGVRSQSA
jgi:photosystem II stability/assembly factor-like uncharacterized protein